jgi:hypothetical protein
MGPTGMQEYSSFAVVEESEVFYPSEVLPLGDPIEIDSSGHCEDDQMRSGPPRSQQRGLKIL